MPDAYGPLVIQSRVVVMVDSAKLVVDKQGKKKDKKPNRSKSL